MPLSNIENEIYSSLGKKLLEALSFSSIEKWDKVYLKVGITVANTVKLRANYVLDGKTKSIRIPSPKPYDEFFDLKAYTEKNNFVPWNRFVFELTPDHDFSINFEWDQDLDGE